MGLAYKVERVSICYLRKRFFKKTKNNKKVRTPNFIAWDCTRRCNLSCEHCGAAKEKYSDELSSEDIKKVIDDISIKNGAHFGVTGGEPLLRKDIIKILAYARSKGLQTGVASNGFLIDKKKANQLKKIGLNSIQISIDGSESVHNKIRKHPESFCRALSAIEYLQKVKIPIVSVATTLTSHNFDELDSVYKLLKGVGVKRWRISVIMPIGRANKAPELLLNSIQLKELFNYIQEKNHKAMYIYLGENLPFLGKYEEKVRDEPSLCPVGIAACCVGVSGNVRGCPEQPDSHGFIEGNITKESILDIWQNGFKSYRLNDMVNKDAKCSNCNDKYRCYGGCSVMRIGCNHCIYDLVD